MFRLFNLACLALLMLVRSLICFPVEYEVGPGKTYAEIEEVPWEALRAGDTVSIHWRENPYRAKLVLCVRGTPDQPICVRGVPNGQGVLPVIDGRNAVTRPQLNYWNEVRGVIKIGGANRPADTTPAHLIVENLEIRSGRPPYEFTGRDGRTTYSDNAAAIFIEKGEFITIRNCILHDCGNGLFIAAATRDAVIEGCSIHDNGIEGSYYQHNTYTAAAGLIYQFNRLGRLRPGCGGNNLKDRSAGLVVRYNWIEDGNRQLDLVDAEDLERLRSDPRYRSTYVYGNVLIEHEGEGNSQIVHYGGDSGRPDWYRKGTLYFYNNTVVSTREGHTTLFRLSTNDERAECWNNILYVTADGDRLAWLNESGVLNLGRNWIKRGWVASHGTLAGRISGTVNLLQGWNPGFADQEELDFRLEDTSPCVDQAVELPEPPRTEHPLKWQYVPHQGREPRPVDGRLDLGAMEALVPARTGVPAELLR